VKVVAALVVALALVPVAGAKNGVHATLTSKLPLHASMGTRLVVTFTLRDASGRPFDAMKVFVKVICPTKDASSFVFARQVRTGSYRAVATVPPGGLGTIRIGLRGSTDVYFPIRNH
jgi:hypothetical protein